MKRILLTLGVSLFALAGKAQSLTIINNLPVPWNMFGYANAVGFPTGNHTFTSQHITPMSTVTFSGFSALSWNSNPPVPGVDNWDRIQMYNADLCINIATVIYGIGSTMGQDGLLFVPGHGNTPPIGTPPGQPTSQSKINPCSLPPSATGYVQTVPSSTVPGAYDVTITLQ